MDARRAERDDLAAIQRLWTEVGWVSGESDTAQLEHWLAEATTWVGGPGDEVEAVTSTHDGRMAVMGTDLPLGAVTSVLTGRTARRLGLAGDLLTRAVVHTADHGAALAALGMFEQGYYDRFGFGTGAPMPLVTFDPANLRVDVPARPPVRLDPDDWAELAALLAERLPSHGRVALHAPGYTRAEARWFDPWVGLGFRDEDGTLTHAMWGQAKGEHGPLVIEWMVWRDGADLLELLGLVRGLGDQYRVATLQEPAEVSLRDVLDQPGRATFQTEGGTHAMGVRSLSWWQARALDLPSCVAARPWPGPPVACTVVLEDPLAARAERATGTRFDRVEGTWRVTFAEESTAHRGRDDELPVLRAGVGAFTRMLLGVAPASTIALTDDLAGPAELLARLDRALLAPRPHIGGWL